MALGGIWIRGDLELSSCKIAGPLTIGLTWLGSGSSIRWWRPRIDGDLVLGRSRTGVIDISGA